MTSLSVKTNTMPPNNVQKTIDDFCHRLGTFPEEDRRQVLKSMETAERERDREESYVVRVEISTGD